MEEINCIFCNIHSDLVVIEENGFKGKKCPSCGLIYISPRPCSEEMLIRYCDDPDHSYTNADSQLGFGMSKKLQAKHTLKIIKKYIKKGSMLELGAGAGYFLAEAKKHGFKVYAIELNKIESRFITNKLRICCENSPLNEQSFNGKKFDIIYHCDVLSHFHDPIDQFKKINNKLEKNGIMVFETGNIADVDMAYYKYCPSFDYPDHLYFFGESTIQKLLETNGFELVKIYRHSIMLPMFIEKKLWKMRNSLKGTRNISHMVSDVDKFNIKRLVRSIYRFWRALLIYKLGSLLVREGHLQTVIVVAKKK